MKFRDIELLSAYLDGQLSPSDAARLEARLSSDASLKATLEDLRETRGLLRRLPQRRAPRSFRLTPKMAGVRPPEPRAYPIFRLATAVATFLFLASVAVNALAPVASQHLAAAPAPVYGIGGGAGGSGGGGPEGTLAPPAAAAPAATEAPLQQPFASLATTATPAGTMAADAATNQAIQTEDALRALGATGPSAEASKAAPAQPPAASQQPVPVTWVLVLGILMVACGVIAWLLRRNSERRIREQWDQK
jgi:anti-sigma factor RsiW